MTRNLRATASRLAHGSTKRAGHTALALALSLALLYLGADLAAAAPISNPLDGVSPNAGPFAKLLPTGKTLLGVIWLVGIIVSVAVLLIGFAKVRSTKARGNTFTEDQANETIQTAVIRIALLAAAPLIVSVLLTTFTL